MTRVRNRCNLTCVLVFCALALLAAVFVPLATFAPSAAFGQSNTDGKASSGCIEVTGLSHESDVVTSDENQSFWFYLHINGASTAIATITSSNTETVTVDPTYTPVSLNSGSTSTYIYCDVHAAGMATITVTCGADKVTIPVVVFPEYAKVTSAKRVTYDKVEVSWQAQEGVTGYKVMRHKLEDIYGTWATGKSEVVAQVAGASASSAVVKAPWNVGYDYYVLPYVVRGGTEYMSEYPDYCPHDSKLDYTLPQPAVNLKVTQSGATALTLTWAADDGATEYEVLRSAKENSGYKRIASTTAHAYTDKKLTKGMVYYYMIRATYPGCGAADSSSFMQHVKKKQSPKATKAKRVALPEADGHYNRFNSNWAEPDTVACYSKGSKLFLVSYVSKKLKIYGINSKMKRVSAKTVKLPKHDVYGGSFHGPDGNNYVALGYSNLKESDKKVVFRVVKYSSTWKKGKSATVRGADTSQAIEAGTVSFAMRGSELFVFTCHQMYKSSDGLRHQSNFAFSVNTKTMEATQDSTVYTSHSFNQFARFKDSQLALVDHGDGFPRAVSVCIQDLHGTAQEHSMRYKPFEFEGAVGVNTTGTTIGGVEIGHSNILIFGTSQPHKFKVAGVKGFGN